MSSVLKSVFAAAAIACGVFAAGAALAQEEGNDTIRKKDGSNVQGQIESEDVNGVSVKVAKGASIGVKWNLIKTVDYAGGSDYRKAKQFLDGGQYNEAIGVLEELQKKADLMKLLK